jgi:hypothetical protein
MVVEDACIGFKVIEDRTGELKVTNNPCAVHVSYDDSHKRRYLNPIKNARNPNKVIRVGLSRSNVLSKTNYFNKIADTLGFGSCRSVCLVYETFLVGGW